MSATITAPSVVDRAGELCQSENRQWMWFAPSGLPTTGEEVARHLEAVLALLDRKGWKADLLAADESPVDLGDIDESASKATMLRHLIQMLTGIIRYEYGSGTRGVDLRNALPQVDMDVCWVASRCLNLVLRARTGAPSADYDAWSKRKGRSFAEVKELLLAGVEFARAYGPEVTA